MFDFSCRLFLHLVLCLLLILLTADQRKELVYIPPQSLIDDRWKTRMREGKMYRSPLHMQLAVPATYVQLPMLTINPCAIEQCRFLIFPVPSRKPNQGPSGCLGNGFYGVPCYLSLYALHLSLYSLLMEVFIVF